jgi:hypothetical protein
VKTPNRHVLHGEKQNGRWTFSCKSWPDLAALYNGDEDAVRCIDEFTRRTLVGAVMVKKLAGGK